MDPKSKSQIRRAAVQNGGYQPRRPAPRNVREDIYDDEFDDDTFDEYDDWDDFGDDDLPEVPSPRPPRTGSNVQRPMQQMPFKVGDGLTEREVRAIVREEIMKILRDYPTRDEVEKDIEKLTDVVKDSSYVEPEMEEEQYEEVDNTPASTGDPMADAINEAFDIKPKSSSGFRSASAVMQEAAKVPVKDQWKVASKELDNAEDDWDTSEALG